MTSAKETLVLGIGNVLMGDEGIGVSAVRQLSVESFPTCVHFLDGGTGGFHLLSLFDEYDPIIIIDATMDDCRAGTVRLLKPKFASDFPRSLSAHDIGLRDLLEAATLLDTLPRLFLITVSIERLHDLSTSISPEVEASLPAIRSTIRDILKADN